MLFRSSADDTAQALAKISKMREEYVASLPKDSAYIARNSQQGAELNYFSKEEVLQTKRNPDTLFSLPVGTLTNVYTEGSYYIFTKIVDRKVAPDTVRAAHILLSLGKGTDEEKKAAKDRQDAQAVYQLVGGRYVSSRHPSDEVVLYSDGRYSAVVFEFSLNQEISGRYTLNKATTGGIILNTSSSWGAGEMIFNYSGMLSFKIGGFSYLFYKQ